MNRKLVRAEWRRAQQPLDAAGLPARGGYWADAVSKDARTACRDARAFLRRIRAYLLEHSFTAAELRGRRPKHG
jgi:hypothetical protein